VREQKVKQDLHAANTKNADGKWRLLCNLHSDIAADELSLFVYEYTHLLEAKTQTFEGQRQLNVSCASEKYTETGKRNFNCC
jgi:hypothetical protein